MFLQQLLDLFLASFLVSLVRLEVHDLEESHAEQESGEFLRRHFLKIY